MTSKWMCNSMCTNMHQHNLEWVMENYQPVDSQIITDRHALCNKPDIVIQEKDSERWMIIGTAIQRDKYIQCNEMLVLLLFGHINESFYLCSNHLFWWCVDTYSATYNVVMHIQMSTQMCSSTVILEYYFCRDVFAIDIYSEKVIPQDVSL